MKIAKHTADFGRGMARWYELGELGREVFFLAANGFPVASYQFMLKEFGQSYRITALENRGAWPGQAQPQGRRGWRQHAEDLIAFLEYRRDTGLSEMPVTVVGHSIGATVSAHAASLRPELFRGIVAIDPATLPGLYLHRLSKLTPLLMPYSGLVTSTARRQKHWASPRDFAEYHYSKPVFRRFVQQAMKDYAEAALVPEQGKLTLRFRRDWEAWNFRHAPSLWRILKKVQCPVYLLRAEHSTLHPLRYFAYHRRNLAENIISWDIAGAGHMAPQEDPTQVAALVHCALDEINSVSPYTA